MKKFLSLFLIAWLQFTPLSAFADLKAVAGGGGGSSTPSALTVSSHSANYPIVLTDAQTVLLHPTADVTARTFTIPANSSVAFPPGTMITFVNEVGAGVLTIAITTDTMYLAGAASTTGSRTLTAYGISTALKVTATEWVISGSGLT